MRIRDKPRPRAATKRHSAFSACATGMQGLTMPVRGYSFRNGWIGLASCFLVCLSFFFSFVLFNGCFLSSRRVLRSLLMIVLPKCAGQRPA